MERFPPQAYANQRERLAKPSTSEDAREHLLIALDFPNRVAALDLLDQLGDLCRWVKVGMELFYAEGPPLIKTLRSRGLNVFLDLKLHDIPHTVASAVRSVSQLDVQLLTIHLAGGPRMLEAAAAAAREKGSPALLGVTVLTSMDDAQLQAVGVPASTEQQVRRLALLAQAAGLAGMVCSPLECAGLRQQLGSGPLLVVPGIRAAGATQDDQSRVAAPTTAMREGASLLVVGRPITRADDPARATEAILEGITAGMAERRIAANPVRPDRLDRSDS